MLSWGRIQVSPAARGQELSSWGGRGGGMHTLIVVTMGALR